MKKFILTYLTIAIALLITAVAYGQELATNPPPTPDHAAQQLGAWALALLKEHAWTIILFIALIISEILDNTGKFKEGSIYRFIKNRLLAYLYKRAGYTPPDKKARFYVNPKALIIPISIILLFTGSSSGAAQGLLTKPDRADFVIKRKAINGADSITTLKEINKLAAVYGVTGQSLDLKTGGFGTLTSTGIGISKAWYKITDKGEVYKTKSITGMLLLGNQTNEPLYQEGVKGDYGILLTAGIGPIALGPGYFFVSKKAILAIQTQFTF